MSCPTFESEVQKALAKETINNSDLFLVLDNGTSYKVTIADLIAAIGATGTIESIAPAGSTPVLSGTAPAYAIRGLVAGNGLNSVLTAQDAIRFNVQVGNAGGITDGVPLIVNTAGSTLNWRRLKAGNGITIDQDGNSLVITNNEVSEASNTVFVSVLTDLPSAVAGVIALADNTDYLFGASFSSPSRFTMGNNTIVRSVDPRAVTLTYTGSETMFTCGEGFQVIKEISLSCPNGKIFNNNGTTTGSFLMRWVLVVSCLAIGDLSKPMVGFYNVLIQEVTGSLGFVYTSGNNKRLVMNQVAILSITNATFTFLELGTAVFNAINISTIEIFGTIDAGQTFISGAAAGANLTASAFAYISQLELLGPMTPLVGVQYGDTGWEFIQSDEIPTTNPLALTYLTATATTNIVTINVPVKLNGVFAEVEADYMATDATGRITLTGKRSRKVKVDAIISGRPTAGTQTYAFSVSKNGVGIVNSRVIREVASGAIGVIPVAWVVEMNTSDFIEAFVTCTTADTDWESTNCVFRAG